MSLAGWRVLGDGVRILDVFLSPADRLLPSKLAGLDGIVLCDHVGGPLATSDATSLDCVATR